MSNLNENSCSPLIEVYVQVSLGTGFLVVSTLTFSSLNTVATEATTQALTLSTLAPLSIDFSVNRLPLCSQGRISMIPSGSPTSHAYQIGDSTVTINSLGPYTFNSTCTDNTINYKAKISKLNGIVVDNDLPSWI